MSYGPLSRRTIVCSLARIGALAAVVGQIAVLATALGEAREGASAAAHVESAGTSVHYAHDITDCANCQARLIHGMVARGAAPVIVLSVAPAYLTVAEVPVVSGRGAAVHPRAPPAS